MKVSVIIAVYNADKYLTQAVESSLIQPETSEMILVEDGSTDGSLKLCQDLKDKYEKVRLLRHPGEINKGAPASFNLGMKNSQYDYIAILGADDYYLPGRFTKAKEIFHENPDCDGVYEAIGIHFETEDAQKKWLSSEMGCISMTTMKSKIEPENLFSCLVAGGSGHFSLDGLVFKKSLLSTTGYMEEKLLLHQDSEFILRLATVTKLLPGRLTEPVAIRRVHDRNRIIASRSKLEIYKNNMQLMICTFHWCKSQHFEDKEKLIVRKICNYCMRSKPLFFRGSNRLSKKLRKRIRLLLLLLEYPDLILSFEYWKIILTRNNDQVVSQIR